MSVMRETAHEIAANVAEQRDVWQRLLDLSRAQLQALSVQDVQAVHDILQELEIVMLERSRTELRRGMLISGAASKLGIAPESMTREIVASHCDPDVAEALTHAAEELRSLVVELDSIVSRNTTLLQQELAIIDVLVRGVTTDTRANTTYSKHGEQQDAPRLRLLDAQV